MVHYLNIFHAQHLYPLLHQLFGISVGPIVQFDEIVVISLEPLAFTSVNFHYFCVEFINLLFQCVDTILLVASMIGMVFKHILLIFLNFFDLIFNVRPVIEEHGVEQSFDFGCESLLDFVEFIESLDFFLFDCVHAML